MQNRQTYNQVSDLRITDFFQQMYEISNFKGDNHNACRKLIFKEKDNCKV